jgi:hypothetical protein
MSRFKTGNRIEDAIKHRDPRELAWAQEYARHRLKTAGMKQHEKTWRSTLQRIEEALESLLDEAPNQPSQPTRSARG